MSIASDLLERHLQTLVADPAQWQTLIAADIVWELAYAPALGHPARLTGRDEVIRHVAWFLGAVEGFRLIEPRISAFADPLAAVAQVKAEALIRPTGAHVPAGVRGVLARRGRADRSPARVLRPDAGGGGDERAAPRSRPVVLTLACRRADNPSCT
jgi:hypothetical protein